MKAPKFNTKCRSISVYNFFQANITDDYRYLIKGFDDELDSDKFLIYKDDDALKLMFSEMLIEYASLIADKRTMKIRKTEYQILFLSAQYEVITKVLSIYKDTGVIQVLEILNDIGCKFDEKKEIKPQIDRAIRSAKTIKNKINIHKKRLEKMTKKVDDHQTEEDLIIGLDKTALKLETNLELGYPVDIKKTNVERWVNLIKMSQKRVEEIEARNKK